MDSRRRNLLLLAIVSTLLVCISVSAQTDFSKFQHSNPKHARLPCLLCHRRENNSAALAWPGKPNHLPCAGCHAQQFADTNNAICTICHSNVQSGTLKSFPALTTFNMRFSHTQHANTSCNTCHSRSRGGVALSIPAKVNAHNVCFSCHKPGAESIGKNIASCGTCHQPGNFRRTSESARAFRVGFSHTRHDATEGLKCADCHKLRPASITSPAPLNHHARPGASSCMTCHDGKRAFGGDDFSSCVRCHRGNTWRF